MCLAKAYIGGKEGEGMLMDEIASLQVENGKLRLKMLFGEEKVVEASVKEIDFMGSRIVLENAKSS